MLMPSTHLRLTVAIAVVVFLLALAPTGVFAQTGDLPPEPPAPAANDAPLANYDPFVAYAIISPAPLLPLEFGGTGVITSAPGTNGADPLPFPPPNDPPGCHDGRCILRPTVFQTSAILATRLDALNALGGPGKDLWNWTYNVATRTFTGEQNQTIPGYTYPEITIQYRVTANTFSGNAFNGANVNVQPPGYTGRQDTSKDAAPARTPMSRRGTTGMRPTATVKPITR